MIQKIRNWIHQKRRNLNKKTLKLLENNEKEQRETLIKIITTDLKILQLHYDNGQEITPETIQKMSTDQLLELTEEIDQYITQNL